MRELVIGNLVRTSFLLVTTWALVSFGRYPDFETYSLIAYATPIFFSDGLRRAKGPKEPFYSLLQIALAFAPLLVVFPDQAPLLTLVILLNTLLKSYVLMEYHTITEIFKANGAQQNESIDSNYLKEER